MNDRVSLKGTVVVEKGKNGMEETNTEPEIFETTPATIQVKAGLTKNLGNFESLRLSVSITVPCYKEDIDKTYEAVSDKVADILAEELEKYSEV